MGKIVPVRAIKAYMGSSFIAPLILNLGARWRRVTNIVHLPFHSRNPVHVEWEPGWAP